MPLQEADLKYNAFEVHKIKKFTSASLNGRHVSKLALNGIRYYRNQKYPLLGFGIDRKGIN